MAGEIGTERLERLRRGMRQRCLDALVCLKPQNSFYLSGFNPILYSHPVVAILPLEGEPALLVYALRDDHARQSAWVKDVRAFGAWSTKKTMGMDWLGALGAILEELGAAKGTLGMEADFLPVALMPRLERLLPKARFEDASDLLMQSRMVKEAAEVERLRAAARIADLGMAAALGAASHRGSEQEISVEAMAAMNRAWLDHYPNVEVADFGSLEGGIQSGLWCTCMTGERVGFNCDNPTRRVPADGELALVMIWAVCDGLHAENERAFAVGRLDQPRRRAFEAVLEIRAETEVALHPGTTCSQVYDVASAAYRRLGYGSYLPGRIGHGIGLGIHEAPSIAPNDETVLQPGMVLSFEPSLRIPEFGGLQHSDTVLITETGFEFLTRTDRGFIQI